MAFSGSTASTDDLQAALRQPGRFVVGPTSVSAAFPYGGTSLGACDGARVTPPIAIPRLRCPDNSREPYDDLYAGWDELVVRTRLKQWSADGVQLAFTGSTASTDVGRKVQVPGGGTTGLVNGERVKVLFVPDDRNQRCVLLKSAMPVLDAEARELMWSRRERTTLPIEFRARRVASGTAAEVIAVIDRLEDLTL